MEKGDAKLLIDFKEYDIRGQAVYYILPEQVHLLVDQSIDASAWILLVDSLLVKDEYKEIFEKSSLFKNKTELDETIINDLYSCISILRRRLNYEKQSVGQNVLHDLLSSYIGIIALVIYSGLKLHVAGHINIHNTWVYWAHYHIIVAVLSLVFGGLHIKAHWGWYKGGIKSNI